MSPPARSSGAVKKSDSCRESSLWYCRPADSLVTGEAMPIDTSSSSMEACASASALPVCSSEGRLARLFRKRSARSTSSRALASRLLRSANAVLSAASAALASSCCLLRIPLMPAASGVAAAGAPGRSALSSCPSFPASAAPSLCSISQLTACSTPVLPVRTSACAADEAWKPMACIACRRSGSARVPGSAVALLSESACHAFCSRPLLRAFTKSSM
mmetsp:Transcript_10271/g.24501  ORF Transcript_10271/g.24501 Transcript_10271/m.24501 type:complete len:217 (-) Transcript_10271:479-1129(-)